MLCQERAREFALEAMGEDLRRMEALPGNYYNFHPGAHVGQGIERGIELIADTLCQVMFEGQRTCVRSRPWRQGYRGGKPL